MIGAVTMRVRWLATAFPKVYGATKEGGAEGRLQSRPHVRRGYLSPAWRVVEPRSCCLA